MPININKLRELIRTGEFLEVNYNGESESVLSKWIFDVSLFVNSLDSSIKSLISSSLHTLQTTPSDFFFNHDNLKKVVGFLRSVYDNDTSDNKPIASNSQAVFIVHGHDDSLISEVKDCVESLDLKPIVLREQPDKGLTIIEKLEEWLGNCKCAIILYTPCDVGKAATATEQEERARQNVVYEHGLFQGYLGRKRVITLRKGKTVLPGDCSGVVYISVDSDKWQVQLKSNIRTIDQ